MIRVPPRTSRRTPQLISEAMLTIEEVRSLSEFERLGDEWQVLQELAGARSIFLSHPWFVVCARHLLPDQELLSLLLRDGRRLVGVAPLLRQRGRFRGLPVKEIGFILNPLSPFADFLLGNREEGLRAILGYFQQNRTDWDVLRFFKLREDSPTAELLGSLLRQEGLRFRQQVISRTPFLTIRQPWEDFYKSNSQKFKKTRRSVANRVHRLGEITVERICCPEDSARGLEQMLTASARSWKRQQNSDLLRPEFERAFFTDLTRIAAEAGWLHLWLLKKGDDVLASEFHLEDNGTVYALRAHFDEGYASCSPGTYLDSVIVQQLFNQGYRCYDMGPGAADYKLAWTDKTYACYLIEVYNRGVYPQMLERLENSWIPAIRGSPLVRWIRRQRNSIAISERSPE